MKYVYLYSSFLLLSMCMLDLVMGTNDIWTKLYFIASIFAMIIYAIEDRRKDI